MAKITISQQKYLEENNGKLDNKTLAEHTGLTTRTVTTFLSKLPKKEESPKKEDKTKKKPNKKGEVMGKTGMVYKDGIVVMNEDASRISDQNYLKNLPSDLEFTKRYGNDIDTDFMKRSKPEEIDVDESNDLYKEIEQGVYDK